MKIYWLHEFNSSGRLGIMARPKGNDWLEDEILSLQKQNVQVVVSLLEQDEISELGLRKQAEICTKHNIEYLNFPIPDRGIPKEDNPVRNFITRLKEVIAAGSNTVGYGRTNSVAKETRMIIVGIISTRNKIAPENQGLKRLWRIPESNR